MLTADELAIAAGTTTGTIDRLVGLDLLDPPSDDGHALTAVSRIRLLLAFEGAGVSLDDIAAGQRRGAFTPELVDRLMPEPARLLEETHDRLVERLGISDELAAMVRGLLGAVETTDRDPVREDDAQIFALVARAHELGATDDQIVRIVRAIAAGVRRIVRAQRDFIDEVLIEPAIASGLSEREVLESTIDARRGYRGLGAELIVVLLRRSVDDAIFQNLVEMGEQALGRRGVVPPRPTALPAIAFVDVSGYTRIADQQGDEEAARAAQRFGLLVDRSSAATGGRLVKLLGDGAMLAFATPPTAVTWALEFVDRAETEQLPPIHVGVAAGPVVHRDGDYFGAVVNVASRLADRARPREILVTDDVVAASAALPDVRFVDVGPAKLKNVEKPVPVHRAVRVPAPR